MLFDLTVGSFINIAMKNPLRKQCLYTALAKCHKMNLILIIIFYG